MCIVCGGSHGVYVGVVYLCQEGVPICKVQCISAGQQQNKDPHYL